MEVVTSFFETAIDHLASLYGSYERFMEPYARYLISLDLGIETVIAIIVSIVVGFIAIIYLLLRDELNYGKPNFFMDKTKWTKLPVIQRFDISHNTALYRFAFPRPTDLLDLPIGQHLSVMAEIDGKEVFRSYTPISQSVDRGYLDLVVKSYPNGTLSKYFAEMELGDELSFRGPKGNFVYKPNMCREIGMIAGGTGITPMLQIIRAIVENPKDKTKVSLIYANVTEEDILMRHELEAIADSFPNFEVYYVLNKPPKDWEGGEGFVTAQMIRDYCPPVAGDVKILLCGPPPMVKAMATLCEEIGFEKARAVSKLEDQVFKF